MLKSSRSSLALAAVGLLPPAAMAAQQQELDSIRQEIRQLRESYEARIGALEARLKEAEARASSAETSATSAAARAANAEDKAAQAAAAPTASAPAPGGSSRGLAAFNPAVSLILQGRYANLSQDPNRFGLAGFIPGGEIGPGRRGFSLSETELALSASVDDKFYGNAILSVTPEGTISAEEAYILTTALPAGFTLKAGRYFSGIGYLNEQHQHTWDFIDAPLAYQAFLGGQFGNDGVQLKWLAPTELFFEIGAEAGSGQNFPGTGRNRNGSNAGALAARLGGDIGYSHSWRIGLSGLQTHAEDRQFVQTDLAGNAALNSFSGRSRIALADFVYKYAPEGNPRVTNFKLQGEYFRRRESGDLTYDADAALGLTNTGSYRSIQSGWYLQGVYQFMPYWRVGARYDQLSAGITDLASNSANLGSLGFKPRRASVMLDWSPSEFSRVRVQAAQERTLPGVTDNQFFVQYIMTLGAHGAHKF